MSNVPPVLHEENSSSFPQSSTETQTRNLTEKHISWLPTASNAFFFEVVGIFYLIAAFIHFLHTGDGSMLTTLLMYAGAYVGVTEVKPLIMRSKIMNKASETPDRN